MLTFDFDLSGLDSVERTVTSTLDDGVAPLVRDAAKAGAEASIKNHPYTDRTWTLTTHIGGELTEATRGEAEAEVEADTPYAQYVDQGTSRSRPYPFFEKYARPAADEALAVGGEALIDKAARAGER